MKLIDGIRRRIAAHDAKHADLPIIQADPRTVAQSQRLDFEEGMRQLQALTDQIIEQLDQLAADDPARAAEVFAGMLADIAPQAAAS